MTSREQLAEAGRNFAYFADYTLSWLSEGGIRLIPDDGTIAFIETIHYYRDWNRALVKIPRGTGKTTFGVMGMVWIQWRHPWLQMLGISATPDVTSDSYEFALSLCSTHPLLETMRPSGIKNAAKKEFDTPGRRMKGRSWRFRTAGTKITGGRAHYIHVDDLEVKETVTTPAQRYKMRLTLSETANLFYPGSKFRKRMLVGTPWDVDTILNDEHADIVVNIPAAIPRGDGTIFYPFSVLDEEALAEKRRDLRNDWLYRSQYLLDTSRDEVSMPIREADISGAFEAFNFSDMTTRILMIDPAGGRRSATEIREIRQGLRQGDGMTCAAMGTLRERLYVADIFSECTTPDEFLRAVETMVRLYGPYAIAIEKNFNAWATTIRNYLRAKDLYVNIEEFSSTTNKLDKIVTGLVPLFGDRKIVFHERLRHYPALVDPVQSQLLNLRWDTLPTPDDVADVLTMGALQLHGYLYPDSRRGGVSQTALDRIAAPSAVRRVVAAKNTMIPHRGRLYDIATR